MTKFYVGQIRNNAKDMVIGYEVRSPSATGGERRHFSRTANHTPSLERAKAACEAEAARLNAEAAANKARV